MLEASTETRIAGVGATRAFKISSANKASRDFIEHLYMDQKSHFARRSKILLEQSATRCKELLRRNNVNIYPRMVQALGGVKILTLLTLIG